MERERERAIGRVRAGRVLGETCLGSISGSSRLMKCMCDRVALFSKYTGTAETPKT